jgi:hypothetical protein
MRAPGWNSLCWLVDSEREGKRKGGKFSFWRERMRASEIHGEALKYLESLNTGPHDLFPSAVWRK